ncbi:MAG: helix-turn-helix domain-containing protein [Enhydrobacter sp.]|nr:helix-turn-helix domain-containing protein [Enhydrobacter sp.]
MSVAALEFRSLYQARTRLAEAGVIPAAAPGLRASARDAGEALRSEVLKEVRGFSDSGNPRVLPELRDHAQAHIDELVRLFAGGELGDFTFVREHARLRAEQRFPLETTLHAYRCGHRVLSRWMRDSAVASRLDNPDRAIATIADFAIEYTDTISAVMTSEYVAHIRVVAAAQGDRDAELLNVLLAGYDESDGRIAQLLRACGYLEQRHAYCVVAIRSANASEMEAPERGQRILTSLSDLLSGTHIRSLAGLRNGVVVAVASAVRRKSGWTTPQSSLAERLASLLLQWGPSVVVGVSADHPSTSAIPRAQREAFAALEFASVDRRVVRFSTLPLRSLLTHAGGEYVRATAPAWTAVLLDADAAAEGNLLKTLAALADSSLNVQAAARRLGVHANTVYGRLSRIRDLTGLDGQNFHDLVEMLLAADCRRP